MKYKEQALSKIERIEFQLKALSIKINQRATLKEIHQTMESINDLLENLRNNISMEKDEWNF